MREHAGDEPRGMAPFRSVILYGVDSDGLDVNLSLSGMDLDGL